VTVAWGVIFALVRFYWAGAGIAGADTPAARVYIAFIALIGLAGAAVADGLVHGWAARLGRRRLVLLARVGGAVLLLGVAVGVLRWLADGGLGDDGVGGVVITAYVFLGAVLFSLLGRRPSNELPE
jgi:hypothetical protein